MKANAGKKWIRNAYVYCLCPPPNKPIPYVPCTPIQRKWLARSFAYVAHLHRIVNTYRLPCIELQVQQMRHEPWNRRRH